MNKIVLWLILVSLIVISTQSCSQGCYDCNKNASTSAACTACADGYQRTAEGTCLKPTIDNCILFGTPSQCYKCRPSFKLASNQCVKQFSGCVRYSTGSKCVECGFGLKLSNDGCSGVINCNSLDANNKCTQCSDGYSLVGNVCKSSMVNCTESDAQTGACRKCSAGNILSGYTCVVQYVDPEFCYVYDTNGQCAYCKEGFTNLEGICYTSEEIQKIYSGENVRARRILKSSSDATADNTSSTSASGSVNIQSGSSSSQSQSESDSSTVKKPANPIDRCSRYDETLTKCLMCENSYVLVNQACYYGIQGCTSYQVSGKSVVCKQCSEKYELEPTTSICLQRQQDAVKNCFIPSLNKLNCIVCNQGFVEKSGQCVSESSTATNQTERKNCANFDQTTKKCKGCISANFRLENGQCMDINCEKFSSSTPSQCTQCKQYFQLNATRGLCEYKDSNCEKVLQQRCGQCIKTHYLTEGGFCLPTPYGCQIPNEKTTLCSICQSSFTLLPNGTCRLQSPIPNCQTLQTNQNAINKCAACIDGYYPSYDSCRKVSLRCNGYDKDSGYCIGCVSPFVMSRGKCLDGNCVRQSTTILDACDSCKEGYVFRNGLCRYDGANCQVVVDDACSLCVEGFVFVVARNRCVAIGEINSNESKQNQSTTSSGNQQNSTSTATTKPVTPSGSQTNSSSSSTQSTSNSSTANTSTSNTSTSNKPSSTNFTSSSSTNSSSTSSNTSTSPTTTNNNTPIPNCAYQNPINPKICLQCQKEYTLSPDNSLCISTPSTPSTSIVTDPNCQSLDANNNKCKKCNDRFYLNTLTGKCTEVNQLCNAYDAETGACVTCFEGFELEAGRCFLKVQIDPYCIQRAVEGCYKCIDGYFIDQSKSYTCQKLNQFCATWNYQTGKCLTCKQGYSLINGECLNLVDDPNCLMFYSVDKRNCQKCADGYFINLITAKCQRINDYCKTYNSATGECYTCKEGYKLSKGTCEKTITLQTYIKDYYCKTSANNLCTQCYNGYYLNLQNVCRQKNPICKDISPENGDCTQCYQGYYLVSGACVLSSNLYSNTMSSNKNCKVFKSPEVDSCTQCYPGYRLTGGVCLGLNQLCKTVDAKSGLCTACFDGYFLEGGNCLVNMADNPNELDPYCTELSTDFTNCVKCAPGYFVEDDGYCTAYNASYQCETFNPQTGRCVTCPYSYIMTSKKICVQQVQYCTQYDDQSVCVQCTTGFYVKANQCFPRDIKCEIYDPKTGSCSNCIAGYILFQKECIYPTFGADRFCSKYVNSYCTQCAEGSYLFNYRCREVDSNCSKFDYQSKRCLGCKSGLKPRGVGCVSEN